MDEIKMQDKVVSNITGFEGTVTGFCKYLNGCEQWMVSPRVAEDGSFRPSKWIDTTELSIVQSAPPALKDASKIGGPRKDAPKV